MINLLPESTKRELRLDLVYRRTILFLLFILISLGIEAGILFYIKSYIASQNDFFQEKILEKQQRLANTQLQGARDIITTENKTLDKVNKLWQGQVLFVPLLEKFYKTIPANVYLKSVDINRGSLLASDSKKRAAKEVDFMVTGFAKNREALLDFLERLKREPEFDNINFSSAVWFKPSDIEFSLSLTYSASD